MTQAHNTNKNTSHKNVTEALCDQAQWIKDRDEAAKIAFYRSPKRDRKRLERGFLKGHAYATAELQKQLDAERRRSEKLVAALVTIIAISDRKHEAWEKAKEALAAHEATETKKD